MISASQTISVKKVKGHWIHFVNQKSCSEHNYMFFMNFVVPISIFWLLLSSTNSLLYKSSFIRCHLVEEVSHHYSLRHFLDYFFDIIKMGTQKEVCYAFSFITLEHRGFNVLLKLYLNLCSHKWRKPMWSLISNFSSIGFLILYVLLVPYLINFTNTLQNTPSELEFWMFWSSLFHSVTMEWKKKIFEVISTAREYIKCMWVS